MDKWLWKRFIVFICIGNSLFLNMEAAIIQARQIQQVDDHQGIVELGPEQRERLVGSSVVNPDTSRVGDVSLFRYLLCLFGVMPTPWSVSKIQPRMQVFCGSYASQMVPYNTSTVGFMQILDNCPDVDTTRIAFLVHGFQSNIFDQWMWKVKDLMIQKDTVVVIVGWGRGTNFWNFQYIYAASNTQTVGTWLAQYARAVKMKFPSTELWGVGHSLGSHVIGWAGRTSQAFNRITGLDPAGPCFENYNQHMRLQKTDANFVDIIHTNGYAPPYRELINHYGTLIPFGTIDFYPNYGYEQPGCHSTSENHHRSVSLYIWSITNPGQFITNLFLKQVPTYDTPVPSTKKVNQYAEMGYYADLTNLTQTGSWYIETSAAPPWE